MFIISLNNTMHLNKSKNLQDLDSNITMFYVINISNSTNPSIVNTGTITNDAANKGYPIYASRTTSGSVTNSGTIQPHSTSSMAMYVAQTTNFTVTNNNGGTIHGRANYAVYYSNSFDLETRLQSEDRCHRIGTKTNVTYIDIETPKTIDTQIIKALRNKKNLADIVTRDPMSIFMEEEK